MCDNLRLFAVDQLLMNKIAQEFGTPVYIVDESGLINRFENFKSAILDIYDFSTFALSYKTNPIFGLLAKLHEKGAIAEVCSGDEISIAEKLGLYGKDIIFNGPVKTDDQIKHAFQTGIRINCDHADEVIRAENIARQTGNKQKIGIRIAFPEIITKNRSGFNRFGFDFSDKSPECESLEIIKTIHESNWLQLAGLHMHTATNVRDFSFFSDVSKLASKLLQIVHNKYNIELEWIDVGGGLGGIVPSEDHKDALIHPLPSIEQYADAVISPLLPWIERSSKKKIELIFEPGRTLYEAYGGLLMRKIGSRPVKDAIGLNGLVVDAGLGMLPSASEFVHPVVAGKNSDEKKKRYRLYGSSCRQRDILRREVSLPSLDLGSPLLMIGTGAYSMAEAISNFIHFRPGVVLWDSNNNFTWLRRPETLEHISMLEVWK